MAISGIDLQSGYRSSAVKNTGRTAADTSDARDILQQKMDEMYGSVMSGDTGQSFQLGGKSYTQDEWDRMLAKVDRVIDQMRTEIREEKEAKDAIAEAKAAGTHVETEITDDQIAELFRDRG